MATSPAHSVRRFENGLEIMTLARPGTARHFITAHADKEGDLFALFGRMAEFVRAEKAAIAGQFVFGGCKFHDEGMRALRQACGGVSWPVTWIQGDRCDGTSVSGTQVCAVSGLKVEPIEIGGELIGTVYEDEYARYCLLGDVRSANVAAPQSVQTRVVFDKMQAALAHTGMSFRNVVRTWMYLADLLKWYGAFNTARTQFFNDHDVFSTMMPASTGIGVHNPAGAALVSDAFAFAPKDGRVGVQAVSSPLQCSAANYKSSFSRAAEVMYPDCRHLFVSGTASITPSGETAHAGNPARQIALTMKVAGAILQSRGMAWDNVSRAIAYFKDMKDLPLYAAYCRENKLPQMPVALFHADVCRDDLLFEIELDAISCTGDPSRK